MTVTVEAISADIIPNFLTASEAGTAPDIVVWAHDVVGQLVANSAIDPIQMSDTSGLRPAGDPGHDLRRPAVRHPVLGREHRPVPEHRPGRRVPGDDGGRSSRPARRSSPTATPPRSCRCRVGQAGDAYHIYPLFASGGGSFFGTTARGRSRSRQRDRRLAEAHRRRRADQGASARRAPGRSRRRSTTPTPSRCSSTRRRRSWSPDRGPSPTSRRPAPRTTSARSRAGRARIRPARSSASTASISPARARTRRWPRSSPRTS